MSDCFTVTAELDGVTHTFPCQPDQTVLAAAERNGIEIS